MKMQWMNFRRFLEAVKRINSLNKRQVSINCKTVVCSSDVELAKKNGLPIVALESTIITHGMPYPDNLKTAIQVQNVVRKKGAVPATIGILSGQIHVGLNNEQLQTLAKSDSIKTIKCSRRDISTVVAQKLNGGTTVSATMLIANLLDLPIMATGGIGGVHRGAEQTFDISTDLVELGHTPVAVVCSGVKSILDIEKTLEYLETQGVPVVKIGKTDYFPAFYCTETFQKIKVPHTVSNSQEAAKILKAQRELGLQTGLLFAVSIPGEYALDSKEMELAICNALESAKSKNISGKNVTPFLLEEINKITHGQSLRANMALIENNASIAAEIAMNLAKKCSQSSLNNNAFKCTLAAERNPIVIGGAIMDTTLQVKESEIKDDGRTHAGRSRESCGGVGRNIANALISLGLNATRLISVVGNDQPGKAIIKSLGDGAQTVEQLSNMNTARCTVIINYKGECQFSIGEMEIFASISPDVVKKYQSCVENSSFIVLDGNLPLNTIRYVLDLAVCSKIPVWYEPTDVNKATRVFETKSQWQNVLHFISPNRNELSVIGKYLGIPVPDNKLFMDLEEVKAIAEQIAEFIPVVISTLGSHGVLVARKAFGNDPFYDTEGRLVAHTMITSRLYPPSSFISDDPNETFNVSGCGDCLTAGIIYGIHKNLDETSCLSLALKAAALSLTSLDAVPTSLSLLCKDIKCR
ncbi:pseudouridine-metabolizing bifunctional protein C1861.05 isoform X1 [Frieseomelitta varia]|uniref:pseudouridine-metabolizing bifunctional protein C1861.05 isoform X1 n=2 Tax=Frieseomelitta varia TaxID=561572 RepID=UPI001CB698E9|nr:pseudouridine-metabolizing bifunctional protein C1861.05 isoform X1 [Frieseomelitta varia]XP_043518223.1 pseudouridine-metabolizing bifunctional protein C1861.05 isoform X1 [Frieseomelitta varia]